MREIEVNLERDGYKIFLGQNTFKDIKNNLSKYDKILILTNDIIGKIYQDFLIENLKDIEKQESTNRVFYFEIPDGEEHKNYSSVEQIYDFMIENSFFRNSLIISVGGGVVCDMGGFVASTYMRGIDFIQVPTSLLAMVDASIGGKVAINHKENKNLIGSFYQPKAVFIDINFLKTLPKEEFSSGMGEVIKHSLLSSDRSYFDFLKREREQILSKNSEILEEMIYFSCLVKKEFVTADEKETGVRAHLNLGHTYGHALESIFKYRGISHGEGVAKGILFELLLCERVKDERIIKEIEELFKSFSLDPTPIKIDFPALIDAMKKDKKNSVDKIKIVSFEDFGKISLENIDANKIEQVNRSSKNEILAIIDIGTNSVRVFISEITPLEKENKIVRPLLKKVEITALGEGVNENRVLGKEPMERTLKAIEEFYNLAKSYGVTEVRAMATSAVRDAQNREFFIEKIKNIGVIPYIISGELEAYLSFKAINETAFGENLAIIDIGGGSTEVTKGESGEQTFGKSYDIGAVRMTEMFFKNEDYREENIESCRKYILEKISKDLSVKDSSEQRKLYGVAGTVTTHVSVYEKMEKYDTKKVDGYILTKEHIEENLKTFLSKTLEERTKLPGLQPKRAPFVVAGTLILLSLLEIMNSKNIIVSETDNLEGATMILGR